MRIHLVILILAAALQTSLASYAQRVSIVKEEAALSEIFREIGKQTGYDFVYSTQLIKRAKPVSIHMSNASITDVLDVCFENQPFHYRIQDKSILIVPNPIRQQVVAAASQTITITGTVVDEGGNPMPGVTIRYTAPRELIAMTDENGKYTVQVPDGDVELTFSYIGYREVTVQPRSNTVLNVQLELLDNELSTVVVTGLFSRPTENFTGVATTISGDQLRNINVISVFDALKVFDPAMRVPENLQYGSDPNRLPQVSIRGTNNFPVQGESVDIPPSGADFMAAYQTNPSMPLFILDGFEASLQKIYDLDINRIEKITILKDAVATSAYGSRAANGVIVVETKQPKAGKLTVNYNATMQVTGPDLSSYNLLTARDKLELEVLGGVFNGGGIALHQLYYDRLYSERKANIERGVDTYWLAQPLQTGVGQKHSLFLEGGDSFIRYGASFGYTNNKGVMKGSGRDTYEGGMVLSYRRANLLVRNQLSITANRADNSPYGEFLEYTRLNSYWSPYGVDGRPLKILEIFETPGYAGQVLVANPLYNTTLHSLDYSKYLGMTNNTFLEWRFDSSLRLTGKLSITSQKDQSDVFLPADHTAFASITDYSSTEYFLRGSYDRSNGNYFAYDANLIGDYNKHFGKSLVFATLGFSAAEQNSDVTAFSVRGFPNSRLDEVFFGKEYLRDTRPAGSHNVTRRVSVFTSLNYTYDKRYLFDFSWNVDGSTQFGANNRFAPFWAVGLGWNLHEEAFFEGLRAGFVNRLKLRAGVGTTGSQQFSPYMSISTYQYNTAQDYLSMFGASVMSYGNVNLKWQQTQKQNVGADIALWNDRISLRLDAYREITNDLLLDVNTPPSVGVSSYKENVGKLENKGFEGNLSAFLIRNEHQSAFWSIFVNAIHNKNRIREISNALRKLNESNDQSDNDLQTRPQLRFVEGQSVNAIWAVQSMGVDPSNGQEVYMDRNGELTYVWSAADKVIVGDAIPDISGNLGTNVSYKGIQIGLYFSYQLGGTLYNQTLADRIENADIRLNVDERVLLGRWQKPGDDTFFKGLTDLEGYSVTSKTNATSRFLQENNFIEIESLSLGYMMPDHWTSRWKLKNTRIGFQVNNLARLSSIQIERGLAYPFARNFTLNVSTSF